MLTRQILDNLDPIKDAYQNLLVDFKVLKPIVKEDRFFITFYAYVSVDETTIYSWFEEAFEDYLFITDLSVKSHSVEWNQSYENIQQLSTNDLRPYRHHIVKTLEGVK